MGIAEGWIDPPESGKAISVNLSTLKEKNLLMDMTDPSDNAL